MPTTPTAPRQPLSKTRIAFAIVLLQTVILFLFDAQDFLAKVVEIERNLNAAVIGAQAELEFKERADAIFFAWVIDSGLYQTARDWTANMGQGITFGDPSRSVGAESAMWQRVEVFWLALWAMIYRILSAWSWFLVAIPFFAALLFDAVNGREKRKWRFELSSPLKHETYKRLYVWMVAFLVYAPFALVPAPAWALTVLAAGALFLVGGQLRSMQKRV